MVRCGVCHCCAAVRCGLTHLRHPVLVLPGHLYSFFPLHISVFPALHVLFVMHRIFRLLRIRFRDVRGWKTHSCELQKAEPVCGILSKDSYATRLQVPSRCSDIAPPGFSRLFPTLSSFEDEVTCQPSCKEQEQRGRPARQRAPSPLARTRVEGNETASVVPESRESETCTPRLAVVFAALGSFYFLRAACPILSRFRPSGLDVPLFAAIRSPIRR